MFSAYMAKYCDIWQHQLSRLSHLRKGARELYNKEQADSRVPQLEKDLEEARLKSIWPKSVSSRLLRLGRCGS